MKITVINNPDKPHKGRIKNWTSLASQDPGDKTDHQIICGLYVDHPQFKNEWGHTSSIESLGEPNQFGYREVETKNSRYTLVGKELTWEEYVKVRQQLEEGKRAQAYKLLSVQPRPSDVPSVPHNVQKRDYLESKPKHNVKPYYSRNTQVKSPSRDSRN